MTPWQKRARAGMALVAIAVTGVVLYTVRPRESAAPPAPVERLDPAARIETRGGDVIQLKGDRRDLRVEFQGQVTYDNGQTKLVDVKLLAENRGGRNYTITGKEAQVGKDQSSFEIAGDVVLETDDGLVVRSGQASYADTDKIVRAPGPVTFSRGRMTGSGVGFTFDEQRDLLTILDQADVQFAPEGDQGPMSVTAGGFTYARRDRYMRFERTMHMDRGGQLIDANEATAFLFPDRDETQVIELRGQSRVTGGGQLGALRSMAANDMNLGYGEDGRTLRNAVLAGRSEVEVVPTGAVTGQRLAGEHMDIGLEPDGSVRSVAARDAVTVTLPAAKDTGARTIRSTSLNASGNASGIRDMQFREGVEYREAATRSRGARTARARTLDAALEAASGALVEARFSGHFEFTDAALKATSGEAVYQILEGTLALRGGDPRPQVQDEALRIDANTIDITLDPRRMVAGGRVGSTMFPAGKSARRPGLLGDKEPVQVVAEKLTYDEAARTAEYSGQPARLLQGDTTIAATTLTVDETRGDLVASGKVITTLLITEGAAPATGAPKPKPMIGSAATFAYSDQHRRATYTTAAQLDGDQGNLRAATIEIRLARDDNALERLDADGQVTALVDQRTVTGARLSYAPEDAKYVVVGAPVKMVDAECQETSGKTLTFWKASDRVLVDGNNEVRTQTKGGGKCPTPPPQ
jgi:LPS export ABC transporter protein LptC